MSDVPFSPVPELNLLREFEQRLAGEFYADGFELAGYDDRSGLEAGWTRDRAALDRLVTFAMANGSGSFYAFWRVDDRPDLATLPVVVFGDEGGQHVVARDLRELLRLLAFDAEVSVSWDDAYYHRRDGEPHSPGHTDFLSWLREEFGLGPGDPDELTATARAQFSAGFNEWIRPFLPT